MQEADKVLNGYNLICHRSYSDAFCTNSICQKVNMNIDRDTKDKNVIVM